MKNLLSPLIIVFGLSGCSGLLDTTNGMAVLDEVRAKGVEVSGPVLDASAAAVDKYCIVPRAVRVWFRNAINGRTEVATITVICEGDGS